MSLLFLRILSKNWNGNSTLQAVLLCQNRLSIFLYNCEQKELLKIINLYKNFKIDWIIPVSTLREPELTQWFSKQNSYFLFSNFHPSLIAVLKFGSFQAKINDKDVIYIVEYENYRKFAYGFMSSYYCFFLFVDIWCALKWKFAFLRSLNIITYQSNYMAVTH